MTKFMNNRYLNGLGTLFISGILLAVVLPLVFASCTSIKRGGLTAIHGCQCQQPL